jgi:hypothetical protein
MQCEKVLSLLSEYIDEALDADKVVQISQHFQQCSNCQVELKRISTLRNKLKLLGNIQAPPYLYNLIQHRLTDEKQDTWRISLRSALEYRWSRIRTTEALWYVTRALGTITACLFLFMITSAINPTYIKADSSPWAGNIFNSAYQRDVGKGVIRNLGLASMDTIKRPGDRRDPMINNQYFVEFGQSASFNEQEDDFSVLAVVDRNGAAKIQDVIKYPEDKNLLNEFNNVITSARFHPAIENGRAVTKPIVMIFSKISVYD